MPLTDAEITLGLKLIQNPVYICGVHRSGTTLVRDMLDGHPQLVVLPSEGTFFTNLEAKLKATREDERAALLTQEWLRRLANPINQPPYWLLGQSTETNSNYVNFARYVLAWWQIISKIETQWPHFTVILAYACCTQKLEATYWVDKTPTNERFLHRIWNETPTAKIIHVIRDPAAVLASHKKTDPKFDIRNFMLNLKLSLNTAVQKQNMPDSRYLMIEYERVCEYPSVEISRLRNFLNISEFIGLSIPSVAGLPANANSSFGKIQAPGKIVKPEVGPPAALITKTEQQLLSATVYKQAAKLGYALTKITFLRKVFLLLRYRLIELK